MNKIRKALLEMFALGIASGVVLWVAEWNKNTNTGFFEDLFVGLVLSPLLWGIYRLFRFMFFPSRAETSF